MRSHIIRIIQGVIFALSDGPPAVMKLLAHAEHHLAQDFPPGATQFDLFQFEEI